MVAWESDMHLRHSGTDGELVAGMTFSAIQQLIAMHPGHYADWAALMKIHHLVYPPQRTSHRLPGQDPERAPGLEMHLRPDRMLLMQEEAQRRYMHVGQVARLIVKMDHPAKL